MVQNVQITSCANVSHSSILWLDLCYKKVLFILVQIWRRDWCEVLLGMIFGGNIQPHGILQTSGRAGPGLMCQAAPGIAAGFCEELVINPTWFCLSYWAAFSKNSSSGVSSPRRYQKGWPRETGHISCLLVARKILLRNRGAFPGAVGQWGPFVWLFTSLPPLLPVTSPCPKQGTHLHIKWFLCL